MQMDLYGVPFSFSLTVPAFVGVLALLYLRVIWVSLLRGPRNSSQERTKTEGLEGRRTLAAPHAPRRRRHLRDLRVLRHWNVRLPNAAEAPGVFRRSRSDITIFGTPELE